MRTSPLFQVFYESIAKGLTMHLSSEFCSEAHMRMTLSAASTCHFFERKGRRVQMSRWWACHEAPEEIFPWVHTLAMVLSDLLVMTGVLGSVWGSSMFAGPNSFSQRLESGAPATAATVGGQNLEASRRPVAHPREVSDSNREVNKLASQGGFQSQTHLVNHILCSPKTWALMRAMPMLIPTRRWRGQSQFAATTRRWTFEWLLSMARGCWLGELQSTAEVASTPSLAGLACPSAGSRCKAFAFLHS